MPLLEKIQGSWRKRIGQTKTVLGEKVREALTSVLPITLIVLILCFTIAPVPSDVLLAFLVGAVLLIVGMGLFTLGADTAMLPIGERVGAQMTKSRKLWVVILVSFLIGCSFSFESELLEAGIPVRHIEEGCNVPMYLTNIPCESAGAFSGNMVVSMRPIPHHLIPAAVTVTAAMPRVHGAPVQIGYPEAIGIKDINKPDFGDMVTIREGEVPVFWPCGVTPQAAVMNSRPSFSITHAPGHMFITDVKNVSLKL